jgi:NitT/TauT family transport system permease protein
VNHRRSVLTTAAPLVVFAVVVVLWHLVSLRNSPLILPGPEAVWGAARKTAGPLAAGTWITATAALSGLALSVLIGTLVAFAFSQSRFVRAGFYPYAIFLQTVPIVAVAPLVIIWFGRGFQSVVVVAFLISLFPIITNTTTGLLSVNCDLHDLFRLHNASWWQSLLKLQFPISIPYLLAGIKIAAGGAVIGAIVGEFFVGSTSHGLGYLIRNKSEQLRTDELFAAVIASTFLGVVVFGTITTFGDWVLKRWYGADNHG